MSRIQASSVVSSTTRTSGGSIDRARPNCAADAPMVTGSARAMAAATSANASCAGRASWRHVSPRSGHAIQQPSWRRPFGGHVEVVGGGGAVEGRAHARIVSRRSIVTPGPTSNHTILPGRNCCTPQADDSSSTIISPRPPPASMGFGWATSGMP